MKGISFLTIVAFLLLGACSKTADVEIPGRWIPGDYSPREYYDIIVSADGKTEVVHPDVTEPFMASAPAEGGKFQFKLGENAYYYTSGSDYAGIKAGYYTVEHHPFLLCYYAVSKKIDSKWEKVEEENSKNLLYRYTVPFYHATFDRFLQQDSFTIELDPNDTGNTLRFHIRMRGEYIYDKLASIRDALPVAELILEQEPQ